MPLPGQLSAEINILVSKQRCSIPSKCRPGAATMRLDSAWWHATIFPGDYRSEHFWCTHPIVCPSRAGRPFDQI